MILPLSMDYGGAIRESSMLECCKVSHQFHSVPDIDDEIKMKSVLGDCQSTMIKILEFIVGVYGYPDGFSIDEVN